MTIFLRTQVHSIQECKSNTIHLWSPIMQVNCYQEKFVQNRDISIHSLTINLHKPQKVKGACESRREKAPWYHRPRQRAKLHPHVVFTDCKNTEI